MMRSAYGLQIVKENIEEIKDSLQTYLNRMCLRSGSTLEGRVKSAKYILNTKGLVPLLVNENLLFLGTKNMREYDVVLINFYEVLSIVNKSNCKTVVVFKDLDQMVLEVSYKKFHRQYQYAKDLVKKISSS